MCLIERHFTPCRNCACPLPLHRPAPSTESLVIIYSSFFSPCSESDFSLYSEGKKGPSLLRYAQRSILTDTFAHKLTHTHVHVDTDQHTHVAYIDTHARTHRGPSLMKYAQQSVLTKHLYTNLSTNNVHFDMDQHTHVAASQTYLHICF